MNAIAMLADELSVNERTLRRAIGEGTIRAERRSARSLHLTLAERNYVRHAWPLSSKLRSALRTESNVRFAVLFGSFSTATDGPESDVDIVVDMIDASLERMVDLRTKLSAHVGRPVDLIRLRDAETDPAFLFRVVSEGRVLVDRESVWPALKIRSPELQTRGSRAESRRAKAALEGIDKLLSRPR